jgi:hypothetical protein
VQEREECMARVLKKNEKEEFQKSSEHGRLTAIHYLGISLLVVIAVIVFGTIVGHPIAVGLPGLAWYLVRTLRGILKDYRKTSTLK